MASASTTIESRSHSNTAFRGRLEARVITRARTWAVVSSVVVSGLTLAAQAPADVQKAVDAAFAKYRNLQEGKNADYIPALAKVDPKLFVITVITADGKVYAAGDQTTQVSI